MFDFQDKTTRHSKKIKQTKPKNQQFHNKEQAPGPASDMAKIGKDAGITRLGI